MIGYALARVPAEAGPLANVTLGGGFRCANSETPKLARALGNPGQACVTCYELSDLLPNDPHNVTPTQSYPTTLAVRSRTKIPGTHGDGRYRACRAC